MNQKRTRWLSGFLLAGLLSFVLSGCGTLWLNQTASRQGTITIVLINETPYRASFSYGMYDDLDRDPPGGVEFEQLRLEANTTIEEPVELTCARNFAVGTQEFLERVIAADAFDVTTFDPDAFVAQVNFSDAPEGSPLAAQPTVGFASGREWLLGVNYRCGDQLLVTFLEDPSEPGGFRADLSIIPETIP